MLVYMISISSTCSGPLSVDTFCDNVSSFIICLSDIKYHRVLDETVRDKVHRQLAIYLERCTLFLVRELSSFGANLVCKFCCITVSEYAKSSIKDHMFKVT